VNVDTTFYSDIDDLKIEQWSISYKQSHGIFSHLHNAEPEKKWLLSLKVARNIINQPVNDNYQGLSLSVTAVQKFSKNLSIELGVGDSTLDNKQTKEATHLTRYNLKAKIKLNKPLMLHLIHQRDFLFSHSIIEDAATNVLYGDTSFVGLYWRPHHKWRVEGKHHHLRLSDGNASNKLSGALLYGISPGWPWIWSGITAEKLAFNEERAGYYTPKKYKVINATIDGSFPINTQWNASFGASVNQSKEGNNPSGTGYSISAGANWTINKRIMLKVHGSLLESTQETSTWKQDNVNVSINVRT
jgi:hypothetical protein